MRSPILLSLVLLLASCSGSEDSGTPSVSRSAIDRCQDLRVVQLREDLDLLREDEAQARIQELGPEFEEIAGIESYLLRARMFAMRGDLTSAHPLIEAARSRAPEDPRVYATAAEVYGAPGQFDTAANEIREGLRICGNTPEMLRAQAILLLCRPELGSARKGLAKLNEAVLADPELPFTRRALGQAYLLVARQELAEGDKEASLADAKSSLEYDPSETEAWHFLAEVLSATNDHQGAIKVLDQLIELGKPLEAELALTHKKAGVQSLVVKDRTGALDHFMAARALGLDDEELGFGAQALLDEASSEIKLGLEALAQSELPRARDAFTRALVYDPESLAARNHLGVVQFKMSDYSGAVDSWRAVLLEATELGLQLPDPVHINLAKAQMRLDDVEGALLTLKDYLLVEPFGVYVDETRELVTLMEKQ